MSREFPPDMGGIGNYSYELANALSQNGNEVTVITKQSNEKFKDETFEVLKLPYSKRNNFVSMVYTLVFGSFKLYKELKNNYDVVHLVDPSYQIVGYFVSLVKNYNLIITVHGSEVIRFSNKRIFKNIMTRLYNKTDKLICVSNYTKELLINNFKVKNKISVVPCGISNNFILKKVQRESTREKYNIGSKDTVLFTLARLDPRKGHDIVLKVLKEGNINSENVKYFIGGIGPDEKRLKALVTKYGIEDKVKFLGKIDENEKTELYDACDIFVMPNRQDKYNVEGFGISYLEAGARGKLAIANNQGGARDAIIHRKTGILLNEGQETIELAKEINFFIENPSVMKKYGENSKKRILKNFTWKTIANTIYS